MTNTETSTDSVFVKRTCGKERNANTGNGALSTLSQEDPASEEILITIGLRLESPMTLNVTEKELIMLISGDTVPVKTLIWDASISTMKRWIETALEILILS